VSSKGVIAELRSPRTVRERCARVLDAGLRGELRHFQIDLSRLDEAARLTAEVTRGRYPDLTVPPHSRLAHFDAEGIKRVAALEAQISSADPRERARCLTDVIVTSVLLDAGAGSSWRYREASTGLSIGRSEGLAVASLAWAQTGGLSSRGRAYEVDAAGLVAVDAQSLSRAFQVTDDNPLVGVDGRVHLLRALGAVLTERRDVFGEARVGNLIDYLWQRADGDRLPAERILAAVLDSLGSIWPGRIAIDGEPLGDVWRHPAAGGDGASAGLVPFHKLSQWLSYSLLHPLRASGLSVIDLDALTGLPEYRNGGLLLDTGVLVLRAADAVTRAHAVDSELVVEWRALTVALLDRIAPKVRAELGVTAEQLPLASVLEGGTWAAGREIAKRLRADGGPPLQIISDGTVF